MSAWRTLSALDGAAAEALAAKLGRLERQRSSTTAQADLDARSLSSLLYVAYRGGSGEAQLAEGRYYDVRFLADRIMVSAAGSVNTVAEMPYSDVDAVEVSGADRTGSSGTTALIVIALALLGGLLGLLILGILGFLLGALIFAAIGAAIGGAAAKIETTIRIRGARAEMFFLSTLKRPEQMRIELSEPLRIISNNGEVSSPGPRPPADQKPESAPDQLSKLASLLQQGLITRDEFDRLKADLITKPVGLHKDTDNS